VIAYLWLAIIGHEVGEDLVRALQKGLGPRALTAAVAIAAVLLAVRVAMRLGVRLPADGSGAAAVRRSFAAFVAVSLALCYAFLVAIPTEAVHFLQYALPVFPLVALTRRPGATIATLSLVGVVDEAWQYGVLHPHWGVSLDFNDIVMNVLGAALGVLVVLLESPIVWRGGSFSEKLRRLDVPIVRFLLALVAVFALARLSGLVSFGPGDARARAGALLLARSAPSPTFWTMAGWSEKRFHTLAPAPGLLLTASLVGALLFLDAFVVVRKRASGDLG
jgi:hypothetical protein